jgi:hypothetical protein
MKLSLRCIAYGPHVFEEVVGGACRGQPDSDQVRYLDSYLGPGGLAIKTILREEPYVDRHYIEEYSHYYASAFQTLPASTVRLHFFADVLTDEGLYDSITEAAKGSAEWKQVQARLQTSYRGFVVVRPLPSAPIGRTVLATYADKGARRFTTQIHRVHIMGLELVVHGVPFQQQEVAVGACATTAMWSALTVTSRATGHRGPTPYQVTEAATRHLLTDRHIPADGGLDLQQSLAAVRDCGFTPLVLKASDNFAAFTHALKCYLASGIPVVLLVHEIGGYHAVTAVGFRSPDDEHGVAPVVYEDGARRIITSGFTRLYIHDDRLGPYARMTWAPPESTAEATSSDAPTLTYEPYPQASCKYSREPMTVYAAIVPLYPKLRLTSRGLLHVAAKTLPLMRRLVGADARERLQVEMRFVLSGEYLREILCLPLDDPGRAATFARTAALPRYVGIVRYSVPEGAIGDVVCDTTDIHRNQPPYGNILALVPFLAKYVDGFAEFERTFLFKE